MISGTIMPMASKGSNDFAGNVIGTANCIVTLCVLKFVEYHT